MWLTATEMIIDRNYQACHGKVKGKATWNMVWCYLFTHTLWTINSTPKEKYETRFWDNALTAPITAAFITGKGPSSCHHTLKCRTFQSGHWDPVFTPVPTLSQYQLREDQEAVRPHLVPMLWKIKKKEKYKASWKEQNKYVEEEDERGLRGKKNLLRMESE